MTRLNKKQTTAILDIVGRWAHTFAGTEPFNLDRVKNILTPVYARQKISKRFTVTKGRGKKKQTTYQWKSVKLKEPRYICLDSPLALRIASCVVRGRLAKKDAVIAAKAFGIDPSFIATLRRDKLLVLQRRGWSHDSSPLYQTWHDTVMPYLKAATLAVFLPDQLERNTRDEESKLARKLAPHIAARNLPAQARSKTTYRLEQNDMVAISGTSRRSSGWGQSAENLQFGNFYCNAANDSALHSFADVPWTNTCRAALLSRNDRLDLDSTYSTTLMDAELLLKLMGVTDSKHSWEFELLHAVPLCMTFENTVLLCGTRPVIKRNEAGELHCADGPAVAWPDGSGQYFVDGHALGSLGHKIVEAPDRLTIDELEKEPNEEVKRVAIEKYGWGRYLDGVGATVIDRRENWVDNTVEALVSLKKKIERPVWGGWGTARRTETTTLEQRKLILACRSTGRQYFLAVPENTKTCEEGQRWMAEGANTSHIDALRLPVRLVGAS